jgi:flagellin
MSVINTNVKALVAQESMRSNNSKLSTAMERLSTGLRINSAKDDAAGLAISNRMTAQIRGMAMATRNANDGISMAQTADGAYGQVSSMLQRMRELAVQAATGSVTSDDRASIQLEIDELKAEIQNVAEKTSFNGIKLLDGSSQSIKLQTGTNEGDTISVGFNSVQVKDIGSGDAPALTSVGGSAATFTKFTAGTLTLNGVAVGPSLAVDDTASAGNRGVAASAAVVAASAIAKVAAINRVSEQSGVFAKVNSTTVIGTAMTRAATATGHITINGFSTQVISLNGVSNESNRQTVATAINAISDATGVRAVNTGDDQRGVLLVADDGRNITLVTGMTATQTGLGAAATYVGTYSLYSIDGSPIDVSHGDRVERAGFQATGLTVGKFESNIAKVTTTNRAPAASAGPPLTLNGDTLKINDIAIDASRGTDDSASPGDAGNFAYRSASSIAIAAAINRTSHLHGVTAKAEANILRGAGFTAAADSGTLAINNVTIQLASTSGNLAAMITTINQYTGQTGVVASQWGEGMELKAEDGRVITLGSADFTAAQLGLTGIGTIGTTSAAGVAWFGTVSLSSDKAFTVTRGNEGTAQFENLGFREGTFGGDYTGMKVAEVDVSTQVGAGQAITAIDAALQDVSSAQARSGAFQNRLDAVVSVLGESSENASAARSRILDTDYATETTALAKAQIVQQAATAMLAQANQQQQSVLALLQ